MSPVSPKSSTPPVTRYQIRGAGGEVLAVHCRQDDGPAGKRVWWELPDGTPGLGGVPLADLPLYPTERLGDWSDPVVVTEGEKAAEALVAAGIPALGTVTGAAGCPGRSPLAELTGRRILLWPDNDDVGRGHMARTGAALAGIASDVRIIAWPGASEHGDAADYLFPGLSAAALHEMAAGITAGVESHAPTGHPLEELQALLESSEPFTSSDAAGSQATQGADEAPNDAGDGARRAALTVDHLLAIAARAELFHTPDREAYASVPLGEHRETWPVKSAGFADWLNRECWAARGQAPREQLLKDAAAALSARALYDGPERPAFLRVGGEVAGDDAVYVDLGDAAWRAVEIDARGWRVVTSAPICFRRGSSALALPDPVAGGSVEELRGFLNLPDEASWRLVITFEVFALLPTAQGTSFPALDINGQQDSGKSTTARVLRALIDPDTTPLTAPPRDEEDLMVVALDNHLPVFDNLSHLDGSLSDALCRVLDGTGFKRRARYKDKDVAGLRPHCPVIFNGIGEVVTRPDLLDRTILVTQPPIQDGARRSGADFRRDLEDAVPRILGALYDAVAGVLRVLPTITLDQAPRLADFARVGVALELVLGWPSGSFLSALEANRAIGHELALENYPVADLLEDVAPFYGTAAELLGRLDAKAGEDVRRRRSWPKAPNSLSNQLSRIAPSLAKRGIVASTTQVSGQTRWRIEQKEVPPNRPAPSAPPPGESASLSTDQPLWEPIGGADGGAEPSAGGADPGAGGADPGAGDGADGADRVPMGDRHPHHAQDRTTAGAIRAQGADGAGPSSSTSWETPEKTERSAARWLRDRLDRGSLDDHAPLIFTGVKISDVAGYARRELGDLDHPGPIGRAAQEHVGRLVDALWDAPDVPLPNGATCPGCGRLVPFEEDYKRHWRAEHAPEYARDDDPGAEGELEERQA
jgi:hypothetical protein